jgi:hypothetical protein
MPWASSRPVGLEPGQVGLELVGRISGCGPPVGHRDGTLRTEGGGQDLHQDVEPGLELMS